MGETGLAHMFEHMAFKGTDKIGTTDYARKSPHWRRLRSPTLPTFANATKK